MNKDAASAGRGDSFRNGITPTCAHALLSLKGLSVHEICFDSDAYKEEVESWLLGHQPMLSSRSMASVQIALGVEDGQLAPESHHLFEVGKGHSNEQFLACLEKLMFGGCIYELLCTSGSSTLPGITVYALHHPWKKTWVLVKHHHRWFKKKLTQSDFPGLQWAKLTRERSGHLISDNLIQDLVGCESKVGAINKIFQSFERDM